MNSTFRPHIALNVTDLQASLDFYRAFFNAEPSKVKNDYAKFELNGPDQPNLHLSLNVRSYGKNGVLNHLGLQVPDAEAVHAARDRFQAAGLQTRDQLNVTCCYSVQDKVWVHDPDGNAWEIFYTKADSEFESADEPGGASMETCCAPNFDELTQIEGL